MSMMVRQTGFSPTKLREYRLRATLTQAELAAQVGVLSQQVYIWERGTKTPSSKNLIAVARALGISASDLFPEL